MTRADLCGVQGDFQRFVMTGASGIDRSIRSNQTASAQERLAVYSNAYRMRLLEVLGNDFPALKAVTGAARFDEIGLAYLAAHPSTTPSVRWFGRHLSTFLRERSPYSLEPWLTELADFEWKRGEVFDANDAPSATLEEVASIPPHDWPDLRPQIIPAHRRLFLQWNAPAMAKSAQANADLPSPEQEAAQWLLWRKDVDVFWRSLDSIEAVAIDTVAGGATFAEVCNRLTSSTAAGENVPLLAASLLKRWVSDGLIMAMVMR